MPPPTSNGEPVQACLFWPQCSCLTEEGCLVGRPSSVSQPDRNIRRPGAAGEFVECTPAPGPLASALVTGPPVSQEFDEAHQLAAPSDEAMQVCVVVELP